MLLKAQGTCVLGIQARLIGAEVDSRNFCPLAGLPDPAIGEERVRAAIQPSAPISNAHQKPIAPKCPVSPISASSAMHSESAHTLLQKRFCAAGWTAMTGTGCRSIDCTNEVH